MGPVRIRIAAAGHPARAVQAKIMVRVDMSVLKGMDIVSIHSSVENLEKIVNANERKNGQGLPVTGEPPTVAVDLRKYLLYDVSTHRIFA
jgi:hypothetical protein